MRAELEAFGDEGSYPEFRQMPTVEAEKSRCILNIRLIKPAEGAGGRFLIYGSGWLPVTVTEG